MNLLTRRRAMMKKESPVTPYQRVEYLESSGTQYIDTGISPPQLGDQVPLPHRDNVADA